MKRKEKKMYKIRGIPKTYCVVYRWALQENYTIGDFFIEKSKICNTLEDKVRDYNKDGDLQDKGEAKVFGETAIPYTPEGFCYLAWIENNPKFGICLRIFGVNDFEGILCHSGNEPRNTLGCVLVGINDKKGWVSNSRVCLDKICEKLLTKVGMKEKFPFYVKDRGDVKL